MAQMFQPTMRKFRTKKIFWERFPLQLNFRVILQFFFLGGGSQKIFVNFVNFREYFAQSR